ncbi:MAG: tetratricopeptide repeat-containing protein kinase family protein, partial [Lacipirellulaceae bacterium]
EQAAGRLDELGPASDVFSLGATLFMLLTGRPPQDGKDVGEVLMRVQRGLFSKPRALNSAIPRGLEAICLKAMQLSPEDRYAAARQMGEDIEAWLADEPLVALPESVFSRGRRWVKKHRTLVSTAVATLVVALGVSAGGVYFLSQANQRERAAKESAVAAKEEVDRQSKRVEKLLTLSKDSLKNYQELSQADELLSFPMRDFRGELQESAINYYQALSQVAAESESERADRAEAYFQLAATYYEMGDIEKAAEAYDTARKRYRELAEEFPENLDYQYNHAATEIDYADMLVFSQRGPEAEQLLKNGLKRVSALAEKQPKNGEYQRGYAYALASESERLRTVGKLAEASEKLTQATQVLRRYREVAPEEETQENQLRLGRVLLQHAAIQSNGQWKFDASLDKYAEAEQLLRPLYESDDYFASGGYHLATVKLQQGEVLYHQGRGNDAVDRIIEGRDIILDVDSYYPDVPDYYRLYIDLQIQFGELKIGVPRRAARDLGLEAIEEGVDLTQTLLDEMDSQPDDLLRMAMLQKTAGQLHTALEQHEQAEQSYTSAMESLARFDEKQSVEQSVQPSIDSLYAKGDALYAVAEAYTEIHRTEEALALLDQSQEVFENLLQRAPGLGVAYHQLGQIRIERAQCYLDQLHYADAMIELDVVAAHAVEISKVPDSKEMSDGYQIVSNAAKALRLVASRAIWTTFDNLLLKHRYEEFFDQLTKYAGYDKREANKYRLATVLANGIAKLKADDKLAPDKQTQLVEQHATQAVTWLSELWEQGYIKSKKSRFGALISSKPALEDIEEGQAFKALQGREDYQQLIKRIAEGKGGDK